MGEHELRYVTGEREGGRDRERVRMGIVGYVMQHWFT